MLSALHRIFDETNELFQTPQRKTSATFRIFPKKFEANQKTLAAFSEPTAANPAETRATSALFLLLPDINNPIQSIEFEAPTVTTSSPQNPRTFQTDYKAAPNIPTRLQDLFAANLVKPAIVCTE